MKKRVLALILTLSMVFTMLNTAFAASPSDFSDLPADWSRGAVERAIENGLLSGANGKINPTAQLTRAELAAIVGRAFGTSQTRICLVFQMFHNPNGIMTRCKRRLRWES